MADLATVNEGASAYFTATLRDELGALIDGTALDELTLTVYDEATGAILNGRDGQDVLNKNGVTVSALGALAWTLSPADNVVVGTAKLQRHRAMFLATWGGGAGQCPHEITWLVRNLTKLPAS